MTGKARVPTRRTYLTGTDASHAERVRAAQAYQPFTRNTARDTRTPAEQRAATAMRTNHKGTS